MKERFDIITGNPRVHKVVVISKVFLKYFIVGYPEGWTISYYSSNSPSSLLSFRLIIELLPVFPSQDYIIKKFKEETFDYITRP